MLTRDAKHLSSRSVGLGSTDCAPGQHRWRDALCTKVPGLTKSEYRADFVLMNEDNDFFDRVLVVGNFVFACKIGANILWV